MTQPGYYDEPEIWETCPDCDGEGWRPKALPYHLQRDDPYGYTQDQCPTCGGVGRAEVKAQAVTEDDVEARNEDRAEREEAHERLDRDHGWDRW